ncbi:hypothetical protein BC831DRAFT_513548 [Entophlyctis helioformis]|nr:hypothetical protein BC831DRAFT_513548 [Entophlyctis helioformis]
MFGTLSARLPGPAGTGVGADTGVGAGFPASGFFGLDDMDVSRKSASEVNMDMDIGSIHSMPYTLGSLHGSVFSADDDGLLSLSSSNAVPANDDPLDVLAGGLVGSLDRSPRMLPRLALEPQPPTTFPSLLPPDMPAMVASASSASLQGLDLARVAAAPAADAAAVFGFGSFCSVFVSDAELERAQEKLAEDELKAPDEVLHELRASLLEYAVEQSPADGGQPTIAGSSSGTQRLFKETTICSNFLMANVK